MLRTAGVDGNTVRERTLILGPNIVTNEAVIVHPTDASPQVWFT